MKTAVFSAKPFEIIALNKANKMQQHELVFIKEQLNRESTHLAQGCEAVSVFSNDDLSEPVLKDLAKRNIKYITLRSAGYDHVDIIAAQKLKIPVANVPEYSPYSIAEHTIMLMLALNRKLLQADKRLRKYNFELDPLIGFDMNGKTVGIIGTGKIGGVIAKILHGFGCRLLGYDIKPNNKLMEQYQLQYTSIDNLLNKSDIITIHCPLNKDTKYLINKKNISQMKKGVMLINTSRGGIINTLDMIEAIESGYIGYAGLDVYEKEKGLFFYNHSRECGKDPLINKLLEFDNVIITGHQAFLTETALSNIAETTLYNLECFEKNRACKNSIY